MLHNKSLPDFTNLFFPNNFKHFISNFISVDLNKSKLKFIFSSKVKQDLFGSCVSVHEYKGVLHEHLIFNHGKLKCIELINISLMTRHYKILVDYGHKKLTMKKIYIYAVDIESSKILKYYTFLIKH